MKLRKNRIFTNRKFTYNTPSQKENNRMRLIAVIIACVITALLFARVEAQAKYLETQKALADEVLRFHVLANSDSEEDQALKIKVKDEVIAYMHENLGENQNVEQVKVWAENNRQSIITLCERIIMEQGYDYPVRVELAETYFPVKTYGDITFPEGNYEALRVLIGSAEGQNWWCCLYPNLCFIDATHGVVSEEGKEELEEVLEEDEYEMITVTTKFKIKWFFF